MPGTDPENRQASDQKVKFLGLAFAGADLAFEVDLSGRVTLALGAVEQVTGAGYAEVVGAPWSRLLADEDAELLSSLLEGLEPGERKGPLRVTLRARDGGAPARAGSLSVFRLPQNDGFLSCALSLGDPARLGEAPRTTDGLLDREAFEKATVAAVAEARQAGHPLTLGLVEVDAPPVGGGARRRIAAALRLESYGGMGASEIAPQRFALVRPLGAPTGRLSERLKQVCGDAVTLVTADLGVDGQTEAQSLKSLRYALDRYIEDGATAAAASLDAMLEHTAQETAKFRTNLNAGAFALLYQPVVDLTRNTAHHFEALARFEGEESPSRTIQMAEEVGLIVEFDLAVARKVVSVLQASPPSVKIAINLSALSLMTADCVQALTALTAAAPAVRRRLLIEITETQKIRDLERANNVIAGLRKLGHAVCLDDFGAGAATLDYLSRLEVEFIKLDGRYVKALNQRPRDAAVIKHIAALCRELGVSTIAEMVETPATAEAMRGLGVPFGQGWLFGKPGPKPEWTDPRPGPVAARRVGVVEQWG